MDGISDQQVLTMLDLRDYEHFTAAQIGHRVARTRMSVIGAMHRVKADDSKQECLCVKPENKDGGMPRKWWRK